MDEELDFDEEMNVITLTDENGEENKFEFLDLITYEDEEYVVLIQVDDNSGEVVILKLEETDSETEESYVSVDDEAVLDKVFQIFKEKNKDDYNFEEAE